jgi:hypothetical protein
VYKTYSGSGSQPLLLGGLLNGETVPWGKCNIVLKNAKQPGKGRKRDFAQVGVDMSSGTNLKLQFPFSQQKQAKINEKRNAANALFKEVSVLRSQGKGVQASRKRDQAMRLNRDAQVLINLANDEVIRFDQATNAAYLTNTGVSYNQMYNQYLSNSPTLARVMSDMSKFKLSSNLKLNNEDHAQLLFSGINLDRIRDSLQGGSSGSLRITIRNGSETHYIDFLLTKISDTGTGKNRRVIWEQTCL